MNGTQGGDPAKLAQALLTIAERGAAAAALHRRRRRDRAAEQKLAERQQQIDAFRELSSSLALDEVEAVCHEAHLARRT